MRALIRRIFTRGTFAANVATLSSGTAVGQLSVILAAPLLSRLFTPDDFGQLQFILSVALILGALSTLRFEMALPLAGKTVDAIHILILALALAATTAVITVLVFIVDPPLIWQVYQSLEMRSLVYFIPLILFFEANNSIFSFWFTRTKDFKTSSIGKSLLGMGTALAQLTVAISGLISGMGLLLGYLIGQIISVGWYIITFFKTKESLPQGAISFRGLLTQAKVHKNFPLYSSWNVVLNTLARNLPPLLLVSYFSVAEAGFFAIGIRLLNIPLNTLGMSVGQVYFQQIARYRDQSIPMMPLLLSTVGKLTGIIVFPLMITFFWGEQIFGFVFGDSWLVAGRIASIMVPFYFMRFIASPISTVFAVMGKQYLGLIWQILYATGTFASFFLTRSSANFEFTIQIYSLSGASLFLLLLLMTVYATKKNDSSPILNQSV